MTAVAILREETKPGAKPRYRAVAGSGKAHSVGKSPGQALDALTKKLPAEERGTLVIVQEMDPDAFFTSEQMERLRDLLDGLNNAPHTLTEGERAELGALVDAELLASARRAGALAD